MKRIRSCTINGKRWRIEWKDLSKALDGQPALGLCYQEEHRIELEQLTVDK
jgi:hypothetical protein